LVIDYVLTESSTYGGALDNQARKIK
jgi:hypothetical protein